MKKVTNYYCEKCNYSCSDWKEMATHELAHLGMSFDDYQTWLNLKELERRASFRASHTKNESTDMAFDNAINDVLKFENNHGIKEEDIEFLERLRR